MTGRASGVVSSAHNERILSVRKLRQRKTRVERQQFLIEGSRAVGQVLASHRHRVRELFLTPEVAAREPDLVAAAGAVGVATTLVTPAVAATLSDTVHPQGVVAVADIPRPDLADLLAARPRLLVVLVGVGDPGNAGTVIRTADAMGADAVVLTAGSVDPYGGKVVRASAGSVLNVPIVVAADVAATVSLARAHGVRSLAAALDGDPLDQVPDLDAPTAWLFGNEAHGLPDEVGASADRLVRIPMYGGAESFNLATAAGICLYATAHAQRG